MYNIFIYITVAATTIYCLYKRESCVSAHHFPRRLSFAFVLHIRIWTRLLVIFGSNWLREWSFLLALYILSCVVIASLFAVTCKCF